MTPISDKIGKAKHILRERGMGELVRHSRGYVRSKLVAPTPAEQRLRLGLDQAPVTDPGPVNLAGALTDQEVLDTDWTTHRTFAPRLGSGAMTVNWVIPGASRGSGGHQNIFRFVRHLESRGHDCRIYVHDPHRVRSRAMHVKEIREHFPPMRADVELLDGPMAEADAFVATSWPTAYPTYVDPSTVPRFYFVQDFEPLFYALGSEFILAQNTYRFGFHGITAGAWLADRLGREFGMRCDHYEFGADPDLYSLTSRGARNAVLFYARPPTPRRAFELGVLTLRLFAERFPDVEIHLAGWPLDGFETGFDYVDHGVLPLEELNALYNRMSAALVLSLTNCSLLPLELLAAGVVPIMNDAPNNRMVVDNPHIRYCDPSPHALARALGNACTSNHSVEDVAASVSHNRWEDACATLEDVMLGVVRA